MIGGLATCKVTSLGTGQIESKFNPIASSHDNAFKYEPYFGEDVNDLPIAYASE